VAAKTRQRRKTLGPKAFARPPKTGIGMLLRDADAAFNRYLTAQLAAHGVTFSQFQHLRNLWVEDGLTQAELSRRIGIEMASSTAVLDSLESEKLVSRVRNAADRRKINVFLTPTGAALEAPLRNTELPSNRRLPTGCFFRERCPFAIARCEKPQALRPLRERARSVRCHRAEELLV